MTFILLHEFKAEKYLADEPYSSPYDRERWRYVLRPVWINMAFVVEMRTEPADAPSRHRPDGKPPSTSIIVQDGDGIYSVQETPEQILASLASKDRPQEKNGG